MIKRDFMIYAFIRILLATLIFLFFIILINGCSTVKPEPVVIVKTKYKVVQIPNSILKPCEVSKPPEQNLYINSNYTEKEKLLTDYVLNLLTDVENCSLRLKSIKELQTKQESIYDKYNNEVKK